MKLNAGDITCERYDVLHVIDSDGLGGIQTAILSLLHAWPEPRFTLHVVALHGPGPLGDQFDLACPSFRRLARSEHNPLIPVRLRALLSSERFVIVHAHGPISAALCETVRGAGSFRLISHVHNTYPAWRGRSPRNLLASCAYQKADLVVACSNAAAQAVSSRAKAPIRVLDYGIDTERFRPASAAARLAVRERLGFSDEDFVLGAAGRLSTVKRHERILETVSLLRRDGLPVHALIVGSGPEESRLKSRARSLNIQDAVHWPGFQKDVTPYLAAMDAFVMASENEGLPLALLEAMASALPCIVADFPSAKDIIDSDGLGLIAENGAPAAFAAHVARLSGDPHLRKRLGETAREQVVARFSVAGAAHNLARIYTELIEEKENP